MQNSLPRIYTGLTFFGFTIFAAVTGYMIAGWNFLDALYMVVITVFGVGYGETRPLVSPALRVFTMFVIVAGALSTAYTVAGIIQFVTEGEIQRTLGARRMNKEIEALRDHTIVCGLGRVGQILSRKLKQANYPFVAIECDRERVNAAEERGYLVLHGSATDEQVLETAGIARAQVLATVLSDDATNVFITLTARELNPKLTIIARGEMPSTEKKLKLAGADRVVLPASIGAERIAHTITNPAALDFLQEDEGRARLNELLSEIEIQLDEFAIEPNSPFVGKALNAMEVRGKGAFIVVAIRQQDGTLVNHPPHEFTLQEGDTVILLGHKGDIPKFAQRFAMKRELRYRGATI